MNLLAERGLNFYFQCIAIRKASLLKILLCRKMNLKLISPGLTSIEWHASEIEAGEGGKRITSRGLKGFETRALPFSAPCSFDQWLAVIFEYAQEGIRKVCGIQKIFAACYP